MDNLHHQLARLYSRYHVLTQRLRFYRIGKLLCHAVVDIGIKQGTAHVLQRFRNVDFRDFSLSFQQFERPLKSFA